MLHTAAALVAEHGLHAVTMSRIAEEAGIGRATLYKYALMIRERPHDTEIAAALVHRAEHLAEAYRRLSRLIRDLLAEAAAAGDLRDDVAPEELTAYCLHALAAASGLPSSDAVRRLVKVTLTGLRPPGERAHAAGRTDAIEDSTTS